MWPYVIRRFTKAMRLPLRQNHMLVPPSVTRPPASSKVAPGIALPGTAFARYPQRTIGAFLSIEMRY